MEWIVGLAIGLVIGWVLRGWRRGEPFDQAEPIRIENGSQTLYLYSLDRERMRALAERIKAGRPIRYRILVGKGKLLRRSEWDKFTSECVQRGLLNRAPNGIYSPSPTGLKFFEALADPAHARTQQTQEIPGYFDHKWGPK
jgi:hypothetical protein